MKILLKDRFQQPWYLYNIKMAFQELIFFIKNININLLPTISFSILSTIIILFAINFEKLVKAKHSIDYSITFYFKNDLTESDIDKFKTNLKKYISYSSVDYFSKEDTVKEFHQLINLQIENEEEYQNLLPAYIKVIYDKNQDLDLSAINKFFLDDKNVEKIISSGNYLQKLNDISQKLVYFFTVIIMLLLLSITFNYANHIKIFFLSESKKLNLYYLLGTQIKFIKIPLCYRALWQGFFGSILGIILSILLSEQLSSIFSLFMNVETTKLEINDIFYQNINLFIYNIICISLFSFLLVNYLIDFFYKKYHYNYW